MKKAKKKPPLAWKREMAGFSSLPLAIILVTRSGNRKKEKEEYDSSKDHR